MSIEVPAQGIFPDFPGLLLRTFSHFSSVAFGKRSEHFQKLRIILICS